MRGYITNTPSDYDPGSDEVYGITVCASDKRDDSLQLMDDIDRNMDLLQIQL